MRVLIFEPKFVGHFLGFATITARAFAELGCRVTMVLPRLAEQTAQASIKLANLPENIEVRYSADVPKLYQRWANAKLETQALDLALDGVPTDHLVIPSGDFVLCGLLKNRQLRRRLQSLGGVDLVVHNCQQVYPQLGIRQTCWSLLDRLAVSLARGIRLHSVDPFATSSAASSHAALIGNPVHALPHFCEDPPNPPSQVEARAKLGLPSTGRMLGSAGDLGRRKGTELLLDSFVRSRPPQYGHLVLLGRLSGTAKQIIKENQPLVDQKQIICRDEFVPESDFANFFYAMDAIWAGFPRQIGIASTLLYAAAANRPVIASDYGCVGWMTEQFGLGKSQPATLAAMTDAISWYHETSDWRPDPQGVRRLLEYHTTENFNRHITQQLRRRMSISAGDSTMLAEEGAASP